LGYPIPNINAIIQRVGNKKAKLYATMDLTSGYHQAPLAKESQRYTAFITLLGLFDWLRVPMGLKGAPAYFQQVLATIVFVGILYIMCELYIDDIVYGKEEEEYFTNLETVLQRLDKHHLTVNPDKCEFGKDECDYVGHHFTAEGVTHNKERIHKVLQINQPQTSNQLKSFLGVAEYFHDHIKDMASTLKPLRDMITPYIKGRKIKWTTEAEIAFEKIKEDINNCPTLFYVDSDVPSHRRFGLRYRCILIPASRWKRTTYNVYE